MIQKKAHIPRIGPLLRRFAEQASAVAIERVRAFAESQADEFRQAILDQNFEAFDAFPLRPATLAAKMRAHVDLRVMVATGTYVDSIRSFRTLSSNRRNARFHIGFHPRKLARDYHGNITEILLQDVARIQEYGSVAAGIPARPHWRPYRAVIGARAESERERITRLVVWKLRSEVQKGLR